MLERKGQEKNRQQFANYISKQVGRATTDYSMLKNGDRIAVAVSGGQDSLSLLKILDDRRKFVPIKYDLLAIHVDLGYDKRLPKRLERYFKENNYNYKIVRNNILKASSKKEISCFWCSWNRRKTLFETADKYGCRKIALGHHKDDIIQTLLLNIFFNGEISSMSAKQELFKGAITIIRPLVYLEKDQISCFASNIKIPKVRCNCPYKDKTNRRRVEKIIEDLEKAYPQVKTNLFRSLTRIKREYCP